VREHISPCRVGYDQKIMAHFLDQVLGVQDESSLSAFSGEILTPQQSQEVGMGRLRSR
jgi:hypothetical protein